MIDGVIIFDDALPTVQHVVAPQTPVFTPQEPEASQVYPALKGEKGDKGDKGDPGDGSVSLFVWDEILIGAVNGSNAQFTTSFAFVPETVIVRINGLSQRRIMDFNTSGTQSINFTESPQDGDSLRVDYQRS